MLVLKEPDYLYFNPRPPRGGRLAVTIVYQLTGNISIHAPREGGDGGLLQDHRADHLISIHAPREGGDPLIIRNTVFFIFISIHAPREGGDARHSIAQLSEGISIHAPREGGDSKNNRKNSENFCDVYNTISFLHKST